MQTSNVRLFGLLLLSFLAACDQHSLETIYESRPVTQDTPTATEWQKTWKDSQTLVLKKSGFIPQDYATPNGRTETIFATISMKSGKQPILQEVWRGVEGENGNGKTIEATLHLQTWEINALIAGNIMLHAQNVAYPLPFYVALK